MEVFGYSGGAFDRVQIASLDQKAALEDIRKLVVLRTGICSEEQAQSVIRLWNALPEGEQSRCHLPGFAIQLVSVDEIVFSAAICWQCNNAAIDGRLAATGWRTFESSSVEGQQLLALCREIVGEPI